MSNLKKYLSKQYLYKKKYWLTLGIFAIWLAFFDQYDLKTIIKLRRQVYKIEKDRVYYEREIKESKRLLEELTSNPFELEKFAREKYYMKRDNEDVFVIIKPNE